MGTHSNVEDISKIPDSTITSSDARETASVREQHDAFFAAMMKAHEDRYSDTSRAPGTDNPRPLAPRRPVPMGGSSSNSW